MQRKATRNDLIKNNTLRINSAAYKNEPDLIIEGNHLHNNPLTQKNHSLDRPMIKQYTQRCVPSSHLLSSSPEILHRKHLYQALAGHKAQLQGGSKLISLNMSVTRIHTKGV